MSSLGGHRGPREYRDREGYRFGYRRRGARVALLTRECCDDRNQNEAAATR